MGREAEGKGKVWEKRVEWLSLQLGTLGLAVEEGREKSKEGSLGWGTQALLFPL